MKASLVRHLLLAAAVLGIATSHAAAQALPAQVITDWRYTPVFGIGYAGNAPQMLYGGSAIALLPRFGGIGLYVDFKTAHEAVDQRFATDITLHQARNVFRDTPVTSQERWYSANAALVRPMTAELAVYFGGGYAHRTVYQDFQDPTAMRGFQGYYRILDDDATGAQLNLLGGAYFRAGGRLSFQFGAESAPRGITVGATLLFPRQ
jgi:hypothetical protein